MKVSISNTVNGREYKGEFPTQVLAEEWVNSQLAKGMNCPWGKPDHFDIRDENNHPNPRATFVEEVVETSVTDTYKLDENGNQVIPLELISSETAVITKYKFLIPVEYQITYEDNSLEIAIREARSNRRREYPTVEEVIEVLIDNGISSTAMQKLRSKRQLIKEKYPIPSI